MEDIQYQVKLAETVRVKGTLLWMGNDENMFNKPVSIDVTIESDTSCKISVPGMNTFATGQSMDKAFQNLFEEIVFLTTHKIKERI